MSKAGKRLIKSAREALQIAKETPPMDSKIEPVALDTPHRWPRGTRVKVPGDSRIGRVSEYSSNGDVHVEFPVGSWLGPVASCTLWDDHRDVLARVVREAWVRWAETQPSPKPSWLVPYDDLSEPDKEADRQIGESLANYLLPSSAPAALAPALAVAEQRGRESERERCEKDALVAVLSLVESPNSWRERVVNAVVAAIRKGE